MQRIIGISGVSVAVTLLPFIAAAQSNLNGTLNFFLALFNGAVALLITLAILVFFWGLIRYLTSVGESKADGLQIMFYGVITIFVMVSIWGIIGLLRNTFGVTSNQSITPDAVRPRVN